MASSETHQNHPPSCPQIPEPQKPWEITNNTVLRNLVLEICHTHSKTTTSWSNSLCQIVSHFGPQSSTTWDSASHRTPCKTFSSTCFSAHCLHWGSCFFPGKYFDLEREDKHAFDLNLTRGRNIWLQGHHLVLWHSHHLMLSLGKEGVKALHFEFKEKAEHRQGKTFWFHFYHFPSSSPPVGAWESSWPMLGSLGNGELLPQHTAAWLYFL